MLIFQLRRFKFSIKIQSFSNHPIGMNILSFCAIQFMLARKYKSCINEISATLILMKNTRIIEEKVNCLQNEKSPPFIFI